MMPIKGLLPEQASLHSRYLPRKGSNYFSAIMLCMWDNIHGPKILSVWKGNRENSDQSAAEADPSTATSPTNETLITVAIHSLNNEPGRTERISGIESKFFVLEKFNIIAGAFIFTVEVNPGRPEVFSFILVLPHFEMRDYLARFSFYELKTHQLLQKHLIGPLEDNAQSVKSQAKVKECVMQEVKKMDEAVLHLAQLMHSLRHNCIPHRVSIVQTFLGKDLEHQTQKKFLEHAITCHLQTSGHTVVLGDDEKSVTMMLNTLGLFLSEQERQLSRMMCSLPAEEDDGYPYHYEPDLYLQGFVVSPDTQHLPITWADLLHNVLPPCFIHVNNREVRWVEKNVPCFLRMKDENEKKNKKCVELKELPLFKDDLKEYSSRMVSDFIDRMRLLPISDGVRESFVSQFLRHLKLKALALAKYVDAEPKSPMQQAGEQIVGVLVLNRGSADKPRVSREALQQDLSLESNGDLHIVLAFAEKIRSNTYIDVLGDPQSHNEAVIREFEAF